LHSLFVALSTQSAIGDGSQQPGRSGDLAAEAAVFRIVGKEVLRALLACAAGDVEVCVKQQRIAGRNGIGDYAKRSGAIITVMHCGALELLADRGGLRAAGAVRIHIKGERQIQRPVEGLRRVSASVAVRLRLRSDGGALLDALHKREVRDVEVLHAGELN